MREKVLKISEINEITNKQYLYYLDLFKKEILTFNELLLIENLILKLQILVDEFDGDSE